MCLFVSSLKYGCSENAARQDACKADCCHDIVLLHSFELTVGVALTSLWWRVPATMALCTPAADAAATHSKTVAANKPSAAASADMIAPATAAGHVVLMTTCLYEWLSSSMLGCSC